MSSKKVLFSYVSFNIIAKVITGIGGILLASDFFRRFVPVESSFGSRRGTRIRLGISTFRISVTTGAVVTTHAF